MYDRLSQETKARTKATSSQRRTPKTKKAKRMHAMKPSLAGPSETNQRQAFGKVPTPNDAYEIQRPHCAEMHQPMYREHTVKPSTLSQAWKDQKDQKPPSGSHGPVRDVPTRYDPNALSKRKTKDAVERKKSRERDMAIRRSSS